MWNAEVCFQTSTANKTSFKSCSNVWDTIFHGKVLCIYCTVQSKALKMRKWDILEVKFTVSGKEGNSVLSLIFFLYFRAWTSSISPTDSFALFDVDSVRLFAHKLWRKSSGKYCACSMTLVTFLFILRSEQQFSKGAQQIIRTALTRPEQKW